MAKVRRPSVAFLFIGGPHQAYHLAPVAAAFERAQPGIAECFFPDAATGELLGRIRDEAGSPGLRMSQVEVPAWSRWLAGAMHRRSVIKRPLLRQLAARLTNCDVIVTPERTSLHLRRYGVDRPRFVHFYHGAGDRGPCSEGKLHGFDLIAVPGAKDFRRLIDVHGIPPEKVRETGYIKLEHLARHAAPAARLFDDDRPVVFFNPHFDAGISSWPQARAVIAAFAGQDRYNLVVAPHLRLALDMDGAEVDAWQRLAVPGRIIVDLASERLCDMSYTRAADIYLGDMSSQLYEFLATPRPVAFLNAHHAAWRDDPRYAGWHLGEVAESVDDVIATIDRARLAQPARASAQRAAVADAFGAVTGAIGTGAAIVADALPASRPAC